MLEAVAGRPSLAVLCGNSEVEQQVAMLGLDPSLGRGELFGELLPGLVSQSGVDAVYLPSAPCGGRSALPARAQASPTTTASADTCGRSRTRGAPGCASPPSAWRSRTSRARTAVAADRRLAAQHPAWKPRVPRDAGADWDFEDVRDHYLQLLFGVDPAALSGVDPERYLELLAPSAARS